MSKDREVLSMRDAVIQELCSVVARQKLLPNMREVASTYGNILL